MYIARPKLIAASAAIVLAWYALALPWGIALVILTITIVVGEAIARWRSRA